MIVSTDINYDRLVVVIDGDPFDNLLVVEGMMYWKYEEEVTLDKGLYEITYTFPTFPSIDFPIRAGFEMYFKHGGETKYFTLEDLKA